MKTKPDVAEHRPRKPFASNRFSRKTTKSLAPLNRLSAIISHHPKTPEPVKNMGSDQAVVLWWYLNEAAIIAKSQRLLITTGQAARSVGCRPEYVKGFLDTLKNKHIIEFCNDPTREPLIIMLLVHTTNIHDSFLQGAQTVRNDSESPVGAGVLCSAEKLFQNQDVDAAGHAVEACGGRTSVLR